ncbi:hypothetical protein RP20_CCG008519 [Aedes albopictus]|nr:hypothetical protein RP20_CCG008519 [Aedes albopictus]
MLIGSTDEREVKRIFESLKEEFELTSLGEVRHFLGIEVQREGGVYSIRLQKYIEKLIENFGMEQAKMAKSPMDPGFLKLVESGEALEDATKYRSLVGGLLYLAVNARPDIAASTAILGPKFSAPGEADWTAAKRILRYLKATSEYSLRLGGEPNQALTGYSDSDWAGDVGSRKSTSGAVFLFGGGVISWASRRQASVTLSSMEAEYVALSEACQEVVWLRQLLRDFGEEQKIPTVLHEDNQGCLAFVKTERSVDAQNISTRGRILLRICARSRRSSWSIVRQIG